MRPFFRWSTVPRGLCPDLKVKIALDASDSLRLHGVTKTTHPLLICEALGLSLQLLLDDIINTANNVFQDGVVNCMEEFLENWADETLACGENTTIIWKGNHHPSHA